MSVQVSEAGPETTRKMPEGANEGNAGNADRAIQRVSAADQLKATRAKAQEDALAFISGCENLDWKKLPPYVTAQILVKIPRKGKGDRIWYMSLEQAFVFAIRCYEINLSPFSDDVFPIEETWKVGVTTSGKRSQARDQQLNLSPPRFTRKTRPWANPRDAVFGLPEDVGYLCEMVVNGNEKFPASYLAWVSEWAVVYSPVWKAKPEHMCMVRAYEKCLTFASGSGISSMPDDLEIESEVEIVKPEIVVSK